MAWLLKSEIDGRGVSGEEYIKELLPLPRGRERIAITYENLIFLNHLDLVVMHMHFFKECECPPLFCFSKSEIDFFKDNYQGSESFEEVSKILKDTVQPDGSTKWFKISRPKHSLNTFIDVLLNVPTDKGRSFIEENMEKLHQTILKLQNSIASEFIYFSDKTDKKSYSALLKPLKYIYFDYLKNIYEPYQLLNKSRRNNIDEVNTNTQNDDSDTSKILKKLQDTGYIEKIEDFYLPLVPLAELFRDYPKEERHKLKYVCQRWIRNRKTKEPYAMITIKQYIKPSVN